MLRIIDIVLKPIALLVILAAIMLVWPWWLASEQVMNAGQNARWLQSLTLAPDRAGEVLIVGRDDLVQTSVKTADLAEQRHMAIGFDRRRGWVIANIATRRNLELGYQDRLDQAGRVVQAGFGEINARRWAIRPGDQVTIPIPQGFDDSGRRRPAGIARINVLAVGARAVKFRLTIAGQRFDYRVGLRPHDGSDLDGPVSASACKRRGTTDLWRDRAKAWLKGRRDGLEASAFGGIVQALTKGQRSEVQLLEFGGGVSCADPYSVPKIALPGLAPGSLKLVRKQDRVFFAPGSDIQQAARILFQRRGGKIQRFSSISWRVNDPALGGVKTLVAGRTKYSVSLEGVSDRPSLVIRPIDRVTWFAGARAALPGVSNPARMTRKLTTFSDLAGDPQAKTAFPHTSWSAFMQQRAYWIVAGGTAGLMLGVILLGSGLFHFIMDWLHGRGRNVVRQPFTTMYEWSVRGHPAIFERAVLSPLLIIAGTVILVWLISVPPFQPAVRSAAFFGTDLIVQPYGYNIRVDLLLTLWGMAGVALFLNIWRLPGMAGIGLAVFWLLTSLIAMLGMITLAWLGFGSDSTRWLVFVNRRINALGVIAFAVIVTAGLSSQGWRLLLAPLFFDADVRKGVGRESGWRRWRRALALRVRQQDQEPDDEVVQDHAGPGSAQPGFGDYVWALFFALKGEYDPEAGRQRGWMSFPPLYGRGVRGAAEFAVLALLAPLAIVVRPLVWVIDLFAHPVSKLMRFYRVTRRKWLASKSSGALVADDMDESSDLVAPAGSRRLLQWGVRFYRLVPFLVLTLLFAAWLASGGETGIGSLQPSEAAKFGLIAIAGAALLYIDRARYQPDAIVRYWYPFVVLLLVMIFFGFMLSVPALKSDMSPILIIVIAIVCTGSLFWGLLEVGALWNRLAAGLAWRRHFGGQFSAGHDRARQRRKVARAAGLSLAAVRMQKLFSLRVWDRRLRHMFRGVMQNSLRFVVGAGILVVWVTIIPWAVKLLSDEPYARALYETSLNSYIATPVQRLLSWYDLNMDRAGPDRIVEFPDLGDQVTKSRNAIALAACQSSTRSGVRPLGTVVPVTVAAAFERILRRDLRPGGLALLACDQQKVAVSQNIGQNIGQSDASLPDGRGNAAQIMRVPAIQDDFIGAFVIGRFGMETGVLLIIVQCLVFGVLVVGAAGVMRISHGDIQDRMIRQFLSFCMLGSAVLLALHWGISWGNSFGVLPVMGQPMTLVSAGESQSLFMALPIICAAIVGFRLSARSQDPYA